MTDSTKQKIDNVENGAVHQNGDNITILRELSIQNAEYLSKDSSENGQRLYISFLSINDSMESILPKYKKIGERAHEFDFDSETEGNGYRSWLKIVDAAVDYSIKLNKNVNSKTSKIKKDLSFTKEVESYAHLLTSLDTCLQHLESMLKWTNNGEIFPSEDCPCRELSSYEDINQHCFYGRCLGFQFCDSLKYMLNFISLSMVIFSEVYYSDGSFLNILKNSVMSFTKYVNDPDQRSRRLVNISQNAEVDFCKSFWFLSESELMYQVTSQKVAVSKIIHIPIKNLSINVDGKEIQVPLPTSHMGKKTVQVRLISADLYEGMLGEDTNKPKCKPPSRGLLIHCHGGGFVAQSSKSHEIYLREWAKIIKVPILSIDYSLAPEAPFPRALEEVTYAYCWALKNPDYLGSTGERIIAAGDSAGANLLLSTTLKCIHLGVPPPMGLFVAYVPTFISTIPSPARLLCLMDPLLPFGFLMRCMKAYACIDVKDKESARSNSDTESFEEITESDLVELQAHKSPVSDNTDTLTYESLSLNADINEAETENDANNSIDQDENKQYVADYLEKYVLDSDTETDGTKVPVLKQENIESGRNSMDYSIKNRLTDFMANVKNKFHKSPTRAEKYLDVDRQGNCWDEFKFSVPKDPYLSPYLASDEDLKKFPPLRVLTVHMDPCLDDSLMFAKKIKKLGGNVKMDVLDGLCHGFLNFSKVSKEAEEGCKLCAQRIVELLNLDSLPTSSK